jgi:hypothetical protein
MDNHTLPPTTPPPAEDSPEFPLWLCRRIGQKLKEARISQKATAWAVSQRPDACISDQSIYDNERERKKNPGLAQLARHAQAAGLNFLDMMEEIRREVRGGGEVMRDEG